MKCGCRRTSKRLNSRICESAIQQISGSIPSEIGRLKGRSSNCLLPVVLSSLFCLLTTLLATTPKLFREYPSRLCFLRDSPISIGCGRGSQQLSPFIPAKVKDERTTNDRS